MKWTILFVLKAAVVAGGGRSRAIERQSVIRYALFENRRSRTGSSTCSGFRSSRSGNITNFVRGRGSLA